MIVMTMISKFVQIYNQSKLKIIEFVIDSKENLFYENGFLEESDIYAQIETIKENILKLDKEIRFQTENKRSNDELQKLFIERENEKMNLIYLASNNINYIDSLINITNKNNRFYGCLLGLRYYKDGNKEKAYSLLDEWLDQKKYFENHFLLNIVFSELVLEKDISRAYKCLQEALRLRPGDINLHKKLLKVYQISNNKIGIKTEKDILNLLS